eukprot:Nk52_evm42s62 gene=Nk52_evmTU42s62
MGVPKFYRWLSERYCSISSVVKENQIPDFDNLYLDMNGIIHNCSHSDTDNSLIPEEKMFAAIFAYIDALLHIVRPRKLFYLAVDGVAPRAKMNQQRARRYRTAQERATAKAKKRGEVANEEEFDSNCITPGTGFMDRLDKQLQYFISEKCNKDKLWKSIKVLFSGHAAPGEGEHKIMDYIRIERSKPDYDPDTSHCLYGLDADLIILGLSSHEPHFALLREEVTFGRAKAKKTGGVHETTFHLLHHSVLREYLEYEFEDLKSVLRFKYEPERIYDDWVFLGLLVGNDFIPNLPHLHINNDAMDIIFATYKKVLPQFDGYINDSGVLNMERFSIFIKAFAEYDIENYKAMNMDFSCFGSEDIRLVEDEEAEEYNEEEFETWRMEYYREKLETDVITSEADTMAREYVRAIQWVLRYYYSGVPSWGWFYPFHYSPFATDIARIKDLGTLNFTFDLGKPFMPFEQLLAVLPPLSRQHIPAAYHPLMLESSSPILDFFPEDFALDMNGKKAEWEAVVKIEFIDEQRLLQAMRTCEGNLTPYEKQRNTHGPNILIFYDLHECRTVKSPLPNYFPDLTNNHTKCVTLPPLDFSKPLTRGLVKGVQLDVYAPGFPSLKHIPHTKSLRREGVNLFGQPSKGKNMVISMSPVPYSSSDNTLESVALLFLGKSIWAGWPYFQNGFVVAITDGRIKISYAPGADKSKLRKVQCGASEASKFRKESQEANKTYLKRHGLMIGNVKYILDIKLLEGFSKQFTDHGMKWQKLYSSQETPFPAQVCLPDLKFYRPRRESTTSYKEQFPIGCDCFFLGKQYYGSPAVVIGHCDSDKSLSLKISYSPVVNLIKDTRNQSKVRYFNGGFICKKSGLKMGAFNRIASSMKVMQGSQQKPKRGEIQIGFSMKFSGRNKQVIGYTRRVDGQWEYSAAALNVFVEFAQKFPDIVEGLNRTEKMDMPFEDDIIPGNGAARLNELRSWQKTLTYRDLPHVECGSDGLDPSVIAMLEKSVVAHNASLKVVEIEKHNVKVSDIFQVGENTLSPDKNVNFELGDRVVCVRDRGSVPLGLRGTVISTIGSGDKLTLEVIFDEEFPSGNDLAGRCPPKRGFTMQPNWLIDLAHGERKHGRNTHVKDHKQKKQPNLQRNQDPRNSVSGQGSAKSDNFQNAQVNSSFQQGYQRSQQNQPVMIQRRPQEQQTSQMRPVQLVPPSSMNAVFVDPAIQSFSARPAPMVQGMGAPLSVPQTNETSGSDEGVDILKILSRAAVQPPVESSLPPPPDHFMQASSFQQSGSKEPKPQKNSPKKGSGGSAHMFIPQQALRPKQGKQKQNQVKGSAPHTSSTNVVNPAATPVDEQSQFLLQLMQKGGSQQASGIPNANHTHSNSAAYSTWQPKLHYPGYQANPTQPHQAHFQRQHPQTQNSNFFINPGSGTNQAVDGAVRASVPAASYHQVPSGNAPPNDDHDVHEMANLWKQLQGSSIGNSTNMGSGQRMGNVQGFVPSQQQLAGSQMNSNPNADLKVQGGQSGGGRGKKKRHRNNKPNQNQNQS